MYKKDPRLETSEHTIQVQAIKVLTMAHYPIFRANVTSDIYRVASLPKGFPDLFGYIPRNGKIFFIEMKNKTGKLRLDQVTFHKQLMKEHIIHGVARSPEDAIKIVRNELIGYGYPN